MGRARQTHHELPKRVYFERGRYRYKPKGGKAVELGTQLGPALVAYARIVDPIVREKHRTLGEWGDDYMLVEAPKKAIATRLSNVKEWARLRPAFGHMLPTDITQQDVYAYVRERAKTALVRANREKALLSVMLSWIASEGGVERNPLLGMEKRYAGTTEIARDRLVTDREFDLFISCGGEKLLLYCELKDATRLRQKDILTLEVSQLKDDGIEVQPSKTRRRHPRTGKPIGKRRFFPWNPDLRAKVDRLLELKRETERRLGKITPWLLVTRAGNCYYNFKRAEANAFRSLWRVCMRKAIAKAAEQGWVLEPFTEHDLRGRAGGSAKLLGNTEAVFRKHYDRGVEVVEPIRRPS
jgi:hypothetical protein